MTSTPGDNAVAALHRVTAHLAGSEERPGQDDMARAIADALAKRRHIIAQAGTGTGKSLAYLVPAILSSKKIVVATAGAVAGSCNVSHGQFLPMGQGVWSIDVCP